MEIILKNKDGVVLHTANKYCEEDIEVGIETQEVVIIPSKEEQIQEGLLGKVTVQGVTASIDENIKSENIKLGTTILGVEGGYEGIDTSDATALSEDILQDKTAYVNNEKITGTMQEYDGSYTGNTANNGFVVDEELWNSLLSTIDSTKGYKTTKLPEELTQIGPYAFYRLSWLKLPQLPKNIQSIGEYAFYGCNMYFALAELPESITSIAGYAFYNCQNTPLQNLPSQLTVIKENCFYSCNKMTISKLPEKLTSIEKYGFYNCTSITISKLPEGLTSIQQSAFAKCNSITIKELPIGIKTIEPYCFQECSSIPSFKVLGDVTSIGNYAFNKCSALQYIQFPNVTSVPTLGTSVFASTPIESRTGHIYVPNTLVDSFKSATNWSAYASQIKPISELEA